MIFLATICILETIVITVEIGTYWRLYAQYAEIKSKYCSALKRMAAYRKHIESLQEARCDAEFGKTKSG